MNVLAELQSRFREPLLAVSDDAESMLAMLKPAQDARYGDYQANFAMPLAKARGENPRELAARLVAAARLDDLCEQPEVAGPGFINLRLRTDWLSKQISALISDGRVGVATVSAPRTYVIDYSSPNIAKPMHVGHLRSTVIGAALDRLLRFLGHTVVSDNHVGDWGTQFGMITYGYKHFLDAAAYEKEPVAELARLYRLVNLLCDYHDAIEEMPAKLLAINTKEGELKAAEASPVPTEASAAEARGKAIKRLRNDLAAAREAAASAFRLLSSVQADPALWAIAKAHPGISEASRLETARLHAGDPTNRGLWEKFIPECLAMLNRIYDRLGVSFDLTLGESFYQPMLADVVTSLKQAGLAVESDGAQCVFIEGNDAPFIVQKRDGAFTYATSDLATIQYRVHTLKADVILYVVDARQSEHFKLLFATARKWGYDRIELRHVSFGTILGDDKRPFKTRAGDTIGLESLLDESIQRAAAIVAANFEADAVDGDSSAEQQRVATAVGIGAIKYADLCQNRESDYVFSWDKMLAVTGDTAAYMQYAYARVCGIFRRGGIDRAALRAAGSTVQLDSPAERALALQLLRFPEVLSQAAGDYRPNFITAYLFETANCFSTFFEQCPVLKAETETLRGSRLRLADLTARVIERGLDILGITPVERM
jgi:arginyl-tRNA synthetase